MQIRVVFDDKLLPFPIESLNNEPPRVAFPTKEEKEAPNKPNRNKCEAYSPNKGCKAFDMSDALVTSMPCGFNTAAAQINTTALITPRIRMPVTLLSCTFCSPRARRAFRCSCIKYD